MRIAEYKQTGTKTEQRIIHHPAERNYNENGDIVIVSPEWDETVDVEVSVMGMVYRDATSEEVAERERQQAEMPAPEPTAEERITELETALLEVAEYASEQEERNNDLEEALVELAELIGG